MERTILATAILILLISPALFATEPAQGGRATLAVADRNDSAPGTIPPAGIGETEIPVGTISDSNSARAKSADTDELTHQGISTVPQKRGLLDFFSFLRSKPSPEKPAAATDQGPAPSNRPDAPSMPVLTRSGAGGSFVAQPGSDELAHQSLSSAPQDASMLGLTRSEDTAAMMSA
ncbi:MAG TPA: hypothetical protein PLU54_12055, partial [Deltaproteobacteria bacterium]|nr:hypothetical protein [Deltaproteobacteria bacterium]